MIFTYFIFLTWFNSIASIACYLGMCVLICVILLVCINAIAFLNFLPKCGAIIQPKSDQAKLWPEKCMAQYLWNLVEGVTFETRRVSLVYRHAHYRSCLAKNVMFETRRASLVYCHAHYRSCLARKCHVWDTPCIAVYRHAHYRSCLAQFYAPNIAHVTPWFLVRVCEQYKGPVIKYRGGTGKFKFLKTYFLNTHPSS
jgi:hypothetical protein